jgi:hypothetical protein
MNPDEVIMLICNAPFCQSTIAKKSYIYCWVHRAEREKYNVKRMELVMPLWSVKNCKVHGHLRRHQTIANHTNPSGINSPRCKYCKKIKSPYCPIKNKIYLTKHGDKRKNSKLLKTYKITLQEYKVLLENQNQSCAICKTHDDYMDRKKGIKRSLAVDHDHLTGKVRGLLCHRCNTAIGLFNDTFTTVESALKYLRHHKMTQD